MSINVLIAGVVVTALCLHVQRGGAQEPPPFHREPWPIHNGFNHQPTQNDLKALHYQDVTPVEAHEIDRLYDELLAADDNTLKQRPRNRTSTSARAGN